MATSAKEARRVTGDATDAIVANEIIEDAQAI